MNYKGLISVLLKKILLQGALAVGIILFFTFYLGITISDLSPSFTFSLFLVPITLAQINIFSFYLIPKFLFQQQYFWFTVYSAYTAIISTFFIVLSSFYGFFYVNSLFDLSNQFLLPKNLYLIIIGVFILVLLAAFFSVSRESYKTQLRNKELNYELIGRELLLKQEELSYLKMQIHPHFLFNTLNSIYGFAIAKKDQTPALILKLSNLLDYILYQTPKAKVALQDEINHLEDYIALEKLRHGDKLKVKVSFPQEAHHLMVAPMLFLPFLENTFKHGKSQQNDAFMDLKMVTKGSDIDFILRNSVESKLIKNDLLSSGIGLPNIKKRLDLLYPEAHELTINQSSNEYIVQLKIQTEKLRIV